MCLLSACTNVIDNPHCSHKKFWGLLGVYIIFHCLSLLLFGSMPVISEIFTDFSNFGVVTERHDSRLSRLRADCLSFWCHSNPVKFMISYEFPIFSIVTGEFVV